MMVICNNVPQSCPNIFANLKGLQNRSETVLYTSQFILAVAGKYLTRVSLIICRFYPFFFSL